MSGRAPLAELLRFAADLGWIRETVCEDDSLPIQVLRTRRPGPAAWLIAGIHGEEPAPPIAVSRSRLALQALAMPVVLFPLCNPVGYRENRRYADGEHSVGDSEHLLLDGAGRARAARPACPQAAALTRKVVELARDYPPMLSVDLHEDDYLDECYVYSHGIDDAAARAVVGKMRELGEPVLASGTTRFGEAVVDGVVASERDGSIDELIAAERIIVDGEVRDGPRGRSVVVVESGSKGVPLERRVRMHEAIVAMIGELFRMTAKERRTEPK